MSSKIIKKRFIEKMLNEIIQSNKYTLNVVETNKINTPVFYDNELVISVYYRLNEIRIEIKKNGILKEKYNELLKSQLVFQKSTANPEATPNIFSFFVSYDNARIVLTELLKVYTEQLISSHGGR